MKYNLKQYTNKTYNELADEFEARFINDIYKTSSENPYRIRYEVLMPQVDHWINLLGMNIDNEGTGDGSKFKSGLFTVLKKRGWSTTDIPGRWKKIVYK
jgi:hypothetical protein